MEGQKPRSGLEGPGWGETQKLSKSSGLPAPLILQSCRKAQTCLPRSFCWPEPRRVLGTWWVFGKEILDIAVNDAVMLSSEVEGALHQKNTDIFKEPGKSLNSYCGPPARFWALSDCPVNSRDLQGRHQCFPLKEETRMEKIHACPQVTEEGPGLELTPLWL